MLESERWHFLFPIKISEYRIFIINMAFLCNESIDRKVKEFKRVPTVNDVIFYRYICWFIKHQSLMIRRFSSAKLTDEIYENLLNI